MICYVKCQNICHPLSNYVVSPLCRCKSQGGEFTLHQVPHPVHSDPLAPLCPSSLLLCGHRERAAEVARCPAGLCPTHQRRWVLLFNDAEVNRQQLDWLLTVRCQSFLAKQPPAFSDTVIYCQVHLKTRQMSVAGRFYVKFWSRHFLLHLHSNASNVCLAFTQR